MGALGRVSVSAPSLLGVPQSGGLQWLPATTSNSTHQDSHATRSMSPALAWLCPTDGISLPSPSATLVAFLGDTRSKDWCLCCHV